LVVEVVVQVVLLDLMVMLTSNGLEEEVVVAVVAVLHQLYQLLQEHHIVLS
jgi:hypothetical protein